MRTLWGPIFYLFIAFFGVLAPVCADESAVATQEVSAPKNEKVPKKKADEGKMSEEEEQNRDELVKSIEEPRISNKWFRGNYLIYDCDKAFYACVSSRSFVQCTDQRTIRIEERRPALGCAPLKRFDSQKECFKVQYEKMQNQVPKIFCVHPNFR